MTLWHGHLLAGTLPQLHERRRESKELLSGWGEACTTLVPNEKRPSKLLFEETHACADRRLRDMQTIRGFDEASRGNDLNEGLGELDVHVSSSTNSVVK